jgi:hypothetical protein
MRKINFIGMLSLCVLSSCAVSQELSPEISDFMRMLVEEKAPTLAEFSRFSGECGGESELTFTLKECSARGWSIYSGSCVDYSRQSCLTAEHQPSLEISWLRERFSTKGASYRVLSVQPSRGQVSYELVEVEVAGSIFLIFHNTDPIPIGGLSVGISKVNGKKIEDYLAHEKSP